MSMRKLAAEIDKTLKAVAVGVETFEATFDKLAHATNATQKDKTENDLKAQIKKLQKSRDQIKAWIGNNDIKEKGALLDNRRLIETQMERFKALEKEMKMKAFSKEGLIAQSKLDPAEKARRDMIDWVGNTIDELSRQIELTEAEAESLQVTKKKKSGNDRLSELEELNERRSWHISKLELVNRMLENNSLPVEDVENVQEDIKYFVEANAEEDFDYDQGLYDELNLQEEEDYIHDYGHVDDLSNVDDASVADVTESVTSSAAASAPVPKTPAKEEVSSTSGKKGTPASKAASHDESPSPVSAKKVPSRKATMETRKSTETIPPVPVPPPTTTIPVPTPKAAALPPIRYAAAAAAAVASSPSVASTTTAQPETSPSKAREALPAAQLTESPHEEPPAPAAAPSAKVETPETKAPSPAKPEGQTNGHAPPPPPGLATPSPLPATQTPAVPPQSTATPAPAPPGYAPQHAESSRAAQQPPASAQPQPQSAQPGVMGNLMHSFEMAKEMSKRRTNDVHELNNALDGSYTNIPQQLDAEPPRYYHPKNPIKTPSYYPQTRLPILEDKSIYSRLDLDQLFYIFYYMTGTYEQWLAAKELKRQSWRFHKQYLTWFQRAHNPQAITEDYEQGGYYYFDWENSWCQRRKSDFRFEDCGWR
ncbi:uncharacterized protein I303_106808 [Kwoniella dejecticola CBS 10117]|uniref:General negative regulator of transcription subunit n=1 Tax=Kwoniella dejecticola CBS 10117 TaxID=1296121 RepID=A0A1A5ZTR2_9TREE|nr:CCR4-NOT transcription complex subunit 3 [Kwoniella dejecticola CBS 10117]OBR81165.1 CCR4-NOT transcription complex subunit 3 [Kwoniella dejecticola CBS 10117]